MFAMDVPYIPAMEAPVVLAQTTESSAPPVDYILNECQETEHTRDPRSAMRVVDPAYMLKNYIEGRDFPPPVNLADIKITLLQGTSHGNLFAEVDNVGLTSYHYDPDPGFLGDDQAIFMAEYGGKRFKIILDIKVLEIVDERSTVCPDPVLIKAPTPDTSESGYNTDFNLALAPVNFADLSGGALGQANATGITLDDNANGYNWYIDLTPGLNEEFLPTSNPYEWVAKPGSEAEGKMDLVGVGVRSSTVAF